MSKRKLSNMGLVRRATKRSAKEVSAIVGISPTNLSNLEKGDKDTSAVIAYRMANLYGYRTDDLLNFFGQNVVTKEKRPLIRVSHAITRYKEPVFVKDAEELNKSSVIEEYYMFGNDYNRYNLLMTCRARIAQKELETQDYKLYNIAEFVVGKEPDPSNLPEHIKVGAAFTEVTRLKNLSNKVIAKEASVSTSSVSEIENDKGEVLISTLDAVARAIGLTVDELIFLVYPSRTKWIFFVQSRSSDYQNTEIYKMVTSIATLKNFYEKSVEDRANLMLAYKDWLREEWDARHNGKTTLSSLLPTPFRLLNFGN